MEEGEANGNLEDPSVDSDFREERIAARRLRIKRRIETKKRLEAGETDFDLEAETVVRPSDNQIELSRLTLQKLVEDGNVLITNIRVAADSRESLRRLEEANALRLRKDKIEAEEKSCGEKFEEISRKWEFALRNEIPQELWTKLQQQNEACKGVIDEKNKVIKGFEMELKKMDDEYVTNLKQMQEDIDLLVERMEDQVRTMQTAYKSELLQIEQTFESERSALLKSENDEWENASKARRTLEEEFLKKRAELIDTFENELAKLRTQDAEEYNMVKITLETQIQNLEQKHQQMKATYQLNQEKLDYNFQVLKKRNEENVLTQNEQKKKITRQNDVLNKLKLRFAKQQRQAEDDNIQVANDYKRISDLLSQLVKKSQHFLQADAEKFQSLWLLNETECKTLANRILSINELIFSQQLGTKYNPTNPDLSFLENVGPLKTGVDPSSKAATELVRDILSNEGTNSGRGNSIIEDFNNQSELQTSIERGVGVDAIKAVLKLLCEESDFLLEDKLRKLVQSLPTDDSDLMKLDAIFSAIGIGSDEDVKALVSFVYQQQDLARRAALKDKSDSSEYPVDEVSDELSSDNPCINLDPNELVRILRLFVEQREPCVPQPQKRSATGTRKNAETGENDSEELRINPFLQRDGSGDEVFWRKYENFVSENDEQMWTALLEAFEKYYEVLHARSNLLVSNDCMRSQNAELRALLQQYLTSAVNRELAIPPTKLLPSV